MTKDSDHRVAVLLPVKQSACLSSSPSRALSPSPAISQHQVASLNTVIAAAATAAGKTVLQIDPNDFNGSHFASLPLHQFTSFLNSHFTAKNPTCSGHAYDHHDFVALELIPRLLYSDIETTNYALEIPSADKLNIDLGGPRLLFHGDKATDFIIQIRCRPICGKWDIEIQKHRWSLRFL
ncbi:hypothetical protein L3X38_035582 [Prunus dulcis]|uniref:Uncharacterized protein n=1 Tax=Prunus dulcis TaxID=3755 RepID=A0AAD4VK74_PRUDU|nr:hypothetical protein L3X38_035582 [Prunus dulcis]